MQASLRHKRLVFLATDGFEQVELTRPWEALREAGAEVQLVSPDADPIQGVHHGERGDLFAVDRRLQDASVEDYDGLVLPGGVASPDALRLDPRAVAFVRAFFARSRPVAAICHGPWMLVEADVVSGRTLTSWPSLRTDIVNAGGRWVDEPVHVDGRLVTSRQPDDLDAFCAAAVEVFASARAGTLR